MPPPGPPRGDEGWRLREPPPQPPDTETRFEVPLRLAPVTHARSLALPRTFRCFRARRCLPTPSSPRCWWHSGTEVGHHQRRLPLATRWTCAIFAQSPAPGVPDGQRAPTAVPASTIDQLFRLCGSVAASCLQGQLQAQPLMPEVRPTRAPRANEQGGGVGYLHSTERCDVRICAWRFIIAPHLLTRKHLLAQTRRSREEARERERGELGTPDTLRRTCLNRIFTSCSSSRHSTHSKGALQSRRHRSNQPCASPNRRFGLCRGIIQ